MLVCWILEGDLELILHPCVHDHFLCREQWLVIGMRWFHPKVCVVCIFFYVSSAGRIIVYDIIHGPPGAWSLYTMLNALAYIIYMATERDCPSSPGFLCIRKRFLRFPDAIKDASIGSIDATTSKDVCTKALNPLLFCSISG